MIRREEGEILQFIFLIYFLSRKKRERECVGKIFAKFSIRSANGDHVRIIDVIPLCNDSAFKKRCSARRFFPTRLIFRIAICPCPPPRRDSTNGDSSPSNILESFFLFLEASRFPPLFHTTALYSGSPVSSVIDQPAGPKEGETASDRLWSCVFFFFFFFCSSSRQHGFQLILLLLLPLLKRALQRFVWAE